MVYFEGEKIKNLDIELARAAKLKCSGCGEKGAALGCYVKSCRKTYHVPCALKIPNCKWDSVSNTNSLFYSVVFVVVSWNFCFF